MKQSNLQKIQNNLRNKFLRLGVKMVGPETIHFSKDTKIGKNVTIEPYVVFGTKVKIGNNVTIKSFSHLENCKVENKVEIGPYARIRPGVLLKEGSKVGNFVEIKKSTLGKKSKVKIGNNVTIKSFSHLENCKIENKVDIGPYARIRPGTILKEGSKIGNFVEIKKSTLGKNSKASHLTYIGDSTIGNSVNIGAGTITCNYDGVKKSKTKIKNNVFIGSNSSLVAPLTVEEGSVVGAGSVITRKVRKKSLALTRSAQIEVKNYKRKKK